MATRQTTIRFPERTDEQLDELAGLYGDRTKAIVVAIDRLYHDAVAVPAQSAEYNREQAEGHIARMDAMKAEGRPWHPTNKRQFANDRHRSRRDGGGGDRNERRG